MKISYLSLRDPISYRNKTLWTCDFIHEQNPISLVEHLCGDAVKP